MKLQNLVNHVVFLLDESASMSMSGHTQDVIDVFDSQIKFLCRRSQELNQETRVSVYKFNENTQCLVYDMDVMRMPTLKGLYRPSGGTALREAAETAIRELKLTPTIHGDHAMLVFCLTDGEDNRSYKTTPEALKYLINGLGNNWTLAILVPDKKGENYAQQCGFELNNITIWEVNAAGAIDVVGTKVQNATEKFFQARAVGTRGLTNLFELNTNLSPQKVVGNLEQLDPKKYMIINVRKDKEVIQPTVESWTQKPYVVGSSYYQLTKKETIQAKKNILVKHKRTGKVYEGNKARELVGLPNHEVKCAPSNTSDYCIFVQSTSTNRHLVGGTELIVLL